MTSSAGLFKALKGHGQPTDFMARCPAHADKTPSLHVTDTGDAILVHCHAGCTQEVVIDALRSMGLWEQPKPGPRYSGHACSGDRSHGGNGTARSPQPEAEIEVVAPDEFYTPPKSFPAPTIEEGDDRVRYYRREEFPSANVERSHVYHQGGAAVLIKHRMKTGPKFLPYYRIAADGGGELWQNLKPEGFKRVPYVAPGCDPFRVDDDGRPLFWCEGEHDVDTLATLGFDAFTFGSAKDIPTGAELYTLGRRVVIPAHNDEAGRAGAEAKAARCHGHAASIKILHFPELGAGGDITDFMVSHSRAELRARVEQAPEWVLAQENPASDDEQIAALAELSEFAYQKQRIQAAAEVGIPVGALDKLVRQCRAQADQDAAALPHWQVEPSPDPVDGAALLDSIKQVFNRYIVLPKGADTALALWTLHAWTMDAGDISPFLVLVSPTKRCGKTSVLIILQYLTPRSELASNISASALFRYIEEVRPTLLIDEADSFVKGNEEMRGILDSGHTKVAAHVIRNVEVNGEHKPRRFSTWAPKAIATIRALADTLEDRSIVVQLQRKPKAATVARLRKRDSDEFASSRSQAARWAADNFGALEDPDPIIPDVLNDRAADNWRPLLAIADLAGGTWSERAREAACLLSGEGHDVASLNVRLLGDCRPAFGDADVIRSEDLVAKLAADPEQPWAEYNRGKPITQRQLAQLLGGFHITSTNVRPPAPLPQGKGYRRVDFEGAWAAYCPGQNASPADSPLSKRPNVPMPMESAQLSDFASVPEKPWDGSKNDDLSNNHARWDAGTDRKPENGAPGDIDHGKGQSPPVCAQCGGPPDSRDPTQVYRIGDRLVRLHEVCRRFWVGEHANGDERSSP
jgi:hypothetical protein